MLPARRNFRLTPFAASATFLNVTTYNIQPRKPLSELEHLAVDALWSCRAPATADQVREALAPRRALKDSTIRTVLRRLEDKGYVRHSVEGRTYLYTAVEAGNVAARAIRQIIDRFCSGSVEQLVLGMVDQKILDSRELQRLARMIAKRKEE
jgi:BlaI family transcriptional regulator, penicillinase repressor